MKFGVGGVAYNMSVYSTEEHIKGVFGKLIRRGCTTRHSSQSKFLLRLVEGSIIPIGLSLDLNSN